MLYQPPTIRCRNSGSSYTTSDIQWTCTATMPPEFKFGSTDVICEGYDDPDDDYILKGSCGVEYRLMLTEKGQQKYESKVGSSDGYSDTQGGEGLLNSTTATVLFWCVFVGIVIWMAYSTFASRNRRVNAVARRRPRADTGYRPDHDGGDDGGDDPPPPYSQKPSARKTHSANSSQSGQSQAQPWRPGFFSGAAAGAAASYLASSAGGGSRQQQTRQSGLGPGSWEGTSARSRSVERPSGGEPSYSNERHESTGFGGTRRR